MVRGYGVVGVVLAAVVSVAALAGCSGGAASSPASSSASSASPSSSNSSAAPSDPAAGRVNLDCNLVLSDADAASLTPPLTPLADYAPAAGTLGASMVTQGGRPCGWGATGAAPLEVVVALPSTAGLTAAMDAASTGQLAHSLRSDTIYFAVTDGVGRAQVFFGSYWIEVASSAFTTPDEAEVAYDMVIDGLRSAGG